MLNWPSELTPTFKNFVTCEYASLNKQGTPITYPCTPYVGHGTLDISTGLTYPAKAERARRNPKVGLLFSYARGSGLEKPPTVLVLGHAAVRDANLQANTDRYVRASLAKNPATFKGQPKFLLRNLTWYFARIWVEVTPLQILWWPEGNLGAQPQTWEAPRDVALPKSDPEPPGAQPVAWQEAPLDWHFGLRRALKLGKPVLTVVNADGYPVPVRVADARMAAEAPTELSLELVAELVRQSIIIVLGLIMLFQLSPQLMFTMVSVVPVVAVAAVFFGRFIQKLSKQVQDGIADSGTIVDETLQGIQNVKAFANEAWEVVRYGKSVDAARSLALKGARWRGAFVTTVSCRSRSASRPIP
ncbi:MAG: hypothetical protein HC853_03630 [Anaerolineae bacterium]|nr:hypothetical protein [Anaerolineae bacterium]